MFKPLYQIVFTFYFFHIRSSFYNWDDYRKAFSFTKCNIFDFNTYPAIYIRIFGLDLLIMDWLGIAKELLGEQHASRRKI